jgi:plastocyanin
MKRVSLVGGALALAFVMSVGVGNTATTPKTVRMIGRESFIRNALVQSTMRFFPGRITVNSGATIRLVNDTKDPHTYSVVARSNRPSNIDQVFNCKVCGKFIHFHFGKKPPSIRHNHGMPGLNRPGDSILVLPHHTVLGHVSAPAGKTLYIFCAFHPWMQSSIVVR